MGDDEAAHPIAFNAHDIGRNAQIAVVYDGLANGQSTHCSSCRLIPPEDDPA
jgi:hypothetical protein